MDTINAAYTVQPDFIRACKLANTEPTKRQASRFRMGKGRAYKVNRKVENAPPVPSWFEPLMNDPKPVDALDLSEWTTRYRSQAIEQWPKAWALKTLGL